MSKIILIISCFFLTGTMYVENIYFHSVTSIEGVNKPLAAYAGKKLLVVTLPVQQNSSSDSLLHQLDSIGTVYADSLVIIATPSYEDGYLPSNKNTLLQWYRGILSMNIIVTDGLYTRKGSGTLQHPLFQWLTDKNKNNHFDQDVTGARNKFFVWKDGELAAVLSEQTKLGGIAMNELLQGQ